MNWIMFPAFNLWIVLCTLYSIEASYHQGDAKDGTMVMCSVFPGHSYWERKEIKLRDLNLSKCTHITYPGLETVDERPYIAFKGHPEARKAFQALRKENPNLKIILGFNINVTTATNAPNKLGKNLVKYLQHYRMDGIMLTGLTPKSNEDREAITDFIKFLRDAFDETNLQIMYRLSYVYLRNYPIREVKDYLDFILPRPFIYNADNANPSLHSQPLFSKYTNRSVSDTIEYVLQQCVDSRKVLMPLYFQGKQWFVKEKTDELNDDEILKLKKTPRSQNIPYRETCKLENEGWRRIWDGVSKAPLLTEYQSAISYEDEQSIAEKVKFAKSYSLGGIDIYGPELDETTGRCGKGKNPLSKAAIKELHRHSDSSKYTPDIIRQCDEDISDYIEIDVSDDDDYDDVNDAATEAPKESKEVFDEGIEPESEESDNVITSDE